MTDPHPSMPTSTASNPVSLGFKTAMIVIISAIVFAMLAQNVFTYFNSGFTRVTASSLVIIVYFLLAYRSLKKIVATPYFAISLLLTIAIGTAIGTFIIQNSQLYDFRMRYGEMGSKVFRTLQFHDVFHSWWYVGLYFLLAISLIKSSINKGFSKATAGFQIAHLSPIVILIGFLIDYTYGYRGLVDLEVGQKSKKVTVYKDNTTFTEGYRDLPFSLQLENFEFAKYDPDYRIQLWEREGVETEQMKPGGGKEMVKVPKILASFPLDGQSNRKIYGTDIYFRLADFYPNFVFDYTYPDNTDTIAPNAPGVLVDLKTSVGEATLQLRTDRPGQNRISDPSLGTTLEFHWDPPETAFEFELPEEIIDTSLAKAHAGVEKLGKVIFNGKDRIIHFITKDGRRDEAMKIGEFHPFFGKENEGFTVRILFPDVKYLSSFPASKNDELENPVAKVEIWGGEMTTTQTTYLYPGGTRRGGVYTIPKSGYFLALESIKEKQTKYWKSDLSIVNEEDETIKNTTIIVNEPLQYGAYRFYQSNYNPDNPEYSGIGVSYTPGLNIVYLGFGLMFLGTLLMFYFRKLKPANNQ